MSGALEASIAWRSELGRRSANEDKVHVCRDGARCVAVLADGAGGHRGGAEASRRAVEATEAALCGDPSLAFDAATLRAAVLAAHADVLAAQQQGAHGAGAMHSTLVVLWLDLDRACALWSHVGDSRLYRVRDGTASLLTSDDSVVQRMVDAGLLSAEQASTHPHKNQLVAALGIAEDDLDPHTAPSPEPIREGDAFLLCSDGWWETLDAAMIAADFAQSASVDEWLDAMAARVAARAAPRQDNFSAIAVRLHDGGDATVPMPIDR